MKEITTFPIVTCGRLLRISTFKMFKLLFVTLLAIICIIRTTYSYEACVPVKPINVDDDWVSKKKLRYITVSLYVYKKFRSSVNSMIV